MARFPQAEPEIAALALMIMDGLTDAAEDFPTPPVSVEELQARLDAYNEAKKGAVRAETEARAHYGMKDDALEELVDAMKADLRYAEVAVRDRPEKLRAVGWGERAAASALEVPGEVRDLAVVGEGDGWLVLDWKPPVDGGPVSAYTVRRRQRAEGDWQAVGTSVETEMLLSGQPRGVEFEYDVVALNKAGQGKPSAAKTVVL